MFCKKPQEELGLIGANPEDIRDYQIAEVQPKVVSLPNVCLLQNKMTSVQRQNWGTCTSHMADGIAEFHNTKEYGKPIKLSQKFIYYNTKKISGLWHMQGDYLRNALKSVCTYGAPLEKDYPDIQKDSWEDYIKDEPSLEVYKKAEEFKGKTFWNVGKKLEQFNQTFYQQQCPIGFGMMWYQGYKGIKPDGKLPLPTGKTAGGHAIIYVGWEQERFWIRNSWGDNWGNGGYCYIPFNEFEKHNIWNASVMLDIQKPKDLTGWVAGKYLRRIGTEFSAEEKVTPIYRLNLRTKPTTKSAKLLTLTPGQECSIIEGGITQNGHTWWKICINKGRQLNN